MMFTRFAQRGGQRMKRFPKGVASMPNLFNFPKSGGGSAVEKVVTYTATDGSSEFTIDLSGYDLSRYSKLEVVFSVSNATGTSRIEVYVYVNNMRTGDNYWGTSSSSSRYTAYDFLVNTQVGHVPVYMTMSGRNGILCADVMSRDYGSTSSYIREWFGQTKLDNNIDLRTLETITFKALGSKTFTGGVVSIYGYLL